MTKNKRMCIVTKENFHTDEMIRFALQDEAILDTYQSIQSRGAYIKNDVVVLQELITNQKIKSKMESKYKKQIIELVKGYINENSL